jgi:hypothetical protein
MGGCCAGNRRCSSTYLFVGCLALAAGALLSVIGELGGPL